MCVGNFNNSISASFFSSVFSYLLFNEEKNKIVRIPKMQKWIFELEIGILNRRFVVGEFE